MFRSVVAPAFCLFAAVAIWFFPWWSSKRNLAPFDIVTEMMLPWRSDTNPQVHNHFVTDAVTQYIPYRMFAERSFEADGFIGWNPNLFGGTPQYANTMALYFDWTMQLHRLLDFWTAWNLGIALQLLIAGIGMLWFLQRQNMPPFFVLAGALAWMGNSQFIVWIYHRWALSSFCWFPFAILAFCAWEKSRNSRWLALAAAALTLSFLGGTLQHVAIIVIGIVCCWAGSAWDLRKNGWRFQWVHFAGFLVAGLLAAGISSWMLDATIRMYFENSATGHERASLGYSGGITQPLLNLLSLGFYAMPSLAGSPQTLDLLKVLKSDLFNLGAFGTIPFALAMVALFWRGTPMAPRLLMIVGLLLPLTPLVGLFYHRINVLWIFGGLWAGGVFVRDASPVLWGFFLRLTARLGVFLILLWCLASALGAFFREPIGNFLQQVVLARADRSQFGIFRDWLADRAFNLVEFLSLTNVFQVANVVAVLLSWWALHAWKKNQTNPAVWFLPLGIFVQSSLFWFQWTTWTKETNPYEKPALVQFLREHVNGGRVVQIQPSSRLPDGILYNNVLDPVDIAITSGYDSMHPNGLNKKAGFPMPGASLLLESSGGDSPKGWNFLGVVEGASVWSNPSFSLAVTDQAEPLDVRRESPNRMTIRVPSGVPKVHVFENFHSGWTAVGPNNTVVDILPNSDGSMLLEIPDGLNGVWNLSFSPRPGLPFLFILVVSGIGVILLGVRRSFC